MELGELPAGWAKASVCDVGSVVTGNTPSTQNPNNYGGQIPFVKPPQLNDLPIGATREFLSELGAQSARVLPPFSILVSCIGNLGKTGLNKAPVAFNQQINAIVPSDEISPYFLFYQVQSHDFRSQLEAKATATTISIVNKGNFETVKLNIAPLAEQHRIVAKIEELFSELDQGVASLNTAREQLKVYRQSLLKNAFEGKLTAAWRAAHRDQLETATALQQRIARERQARYQQQIADWQTAGQAGPKPKPPKPLPPLTAEELAELPLGWVALSVEQFCEIEDGDRGENYPTKADFSSSGHCLFLNAKNVTKRGFVFQETSFISKEKHLALRKGTLNRGDMVFTSRDTLGNIALYDESIPFQCIRLNSGMFIIRGYDAALTPDFLYYHLNAPLVTRQIEQLQSGTAQPQLPIREFKSFRLVIPSKREQLAIVEELESKLSEADQLDQTLATALQQADALRQSILKKAFHGQLVKQDKNEEPATALLERIRAARATSPAKGRQAKMVSKQPNC